MFLFFAVQVQGLEFFFNWNIKFNHLQEHMISHTNTHLPFRSVGQHCSNHPTRTPFQHRPSDRTEALTWPLTSTWKHAWSGHSTRSWFLRSQNTQKWLDGHCHMWQRFCASTWGCSAFSIDCPNKSHWREKEGMDRAGGGRDTHEWLADLCDREGGRQTRGAWNTTLWPSCLRSCSWGLPLTVLEQEGC